MRVWTIANQKGGVGKPLPRSPWGLRTLLVDIDPHGSMTSYFRYDPDTLEHSTYSLFRSKIDKQHIDACDLICDTGTECLQLLPAYIHGAGYPGSTNGTFGRYGAGAQTNPEQPV